MKVKTATARKEQKARLEKQRLENVKIVANGVCPECGEKLHRNNSMTGWWQCGSYGSDGFRKDGKTESEKPMCTWQCFI